MQKKVRFPYFLFELTSKLEIPQKIKPTKKNPPCSPRLCGEHKFFNKPQSVQIRPNPPAQ